MGQQSNKVQKRRRRINYKKRKKESAKATAVTAKPAAAAKTRQLRPKKPEPPPSPPSRLPSQRPREKPACFKASPRRYRKACQYITSRGKACCYRKARCCGEGGTGLKKAGPWDHRRRITNSGARLPDSSP